MPDQTDYPNLRAYLDPKYKGISDQKLATLMRRQNMEAAEMEGFFDDLGKFASSAGKTILKAAPSILPVAGQLVGTAFGGPAGAAIGGSLGSFAGKAIGGATGQTPAGTGGVAGALGGLLGGSSSASQLLQTVLKPETLNAIGSMALGALGNQHVSVGGTPVPVSAFGNLLKVLSGKTESEYIASRAAVEGIPEYLQDYAGEATADPAQSDQRAAKLYLLLDAASESEQESEGEWESAEQEAEMEMEAMQSEFDAIELLEVAEAEAYESEEA